jgi:hypothetical protein
MDQSRALASQFPNRFSPIFDGTLQKGEGEFRTARALVNKNNHGPSSLAVVLHKVIDDM